LNLKSIDSRKIKYEFVRDCSQIGAGGTFVARFSARIRIEYVFPSWTHDDTNGASSFAPATPLGASMPMKSERSKRLSRSRTFGR
jgi:hypothetical protein